MPEKTGKPFESLTEEVKAVYFEKAAELLDGLLWCDRDWCAWGYGTMRSEDFADASQDDDLVLNVATALYEFRLGLETRLFDKVDLTKEQMKEQGLRSLEAYASNPPPALAAFLDLSRMKKEHNL